MKKNEAWASFLYIFLILNQAENQVRIWELPNIGGNQLLGKHEGTIHSIPPNKNK